MKRRVVVRAAVWSSLVTFALVASSACSGSGQSAPATKAELARGARTYAANCASCHGTDLRGTDRGPSHLSELYKPSHHADDAFLLAALRGVRAHHWDFGDMPPVEGLEEDEIDAIVAYVRTVQEREGFESYPP